MVMMKEALHDIYTLDHNIYTFYHIDCLMAPLAITHFKASSLCRQDFIFFVGRIVTFLCSVFPLNIHIHLEG
jgi:hypothetical protein